MIDFDLVSAKTQYFGRGWVVRVISDGTDKSHYQVICVVNEPGTDEEMLIPCRGKKPFKRNGATVWRYRAEARKDKKSRKWISNRNRDQREYE